MATHPQPSQHVRNRALEHWRTPPFHRDGDGPEPQYPLRNSCLADGTCHFLLCPAGGSRGASSMSNDRMRGAPTPTYPTWLQQFPGNLGWLLLGPVSALHVRAGETSGLGSTHLWAGLPGWLSGQACLRMLQGSIEVVRGPCL
jgi:hypothetical protein